MKLIADIGGTNVRFGLADENGVRDIRVLSCEDYPSLAAAAKAYLDETGGAPDAGAFAIAAPVNGSDRISMPNHVWDFSILETQAAIGLKTLRVINDFAALAYAVPGFRPGDIYQIGGGEPYAGMPVGIIGPGTGLGVAAVVFDENGKPVPVATEGGHVTMPATTQREFDLFSWLKDTKYSHVSAERVVSGKGLVNLYHAISGVDGLGLPEKSPSEITKAGMDESCPACVEALDLFCHFLGIVAGNLALSYGAFGGVYIAGGIIMQLGDTLRNSRFRASFEDKGRFHEYMQRIPVFVVTHPYPGLEGLKRLS